MTYAAKIEKAEARIDWTGPAREVLRHIHGLSPFPGAWCEIEIDGEQARIKILRCEPAKGAARRAKCSTITSPSPAATARSVSRTAARRQGADEGRGLSARYAAKAAGAARLMPRYKLTIEYDGTPFCRLADPGQRAVGAGRAGGGGQAICGEQVRVHGAGRTDAGVHALAQVAHFDLVEGVSAGPHA